MARPRELAIAEYLVARGYRGTERRAGRTVAVGGDQSRAAEALAAAEAAFPQETVTDPEFEAAVADSRSDAVSDAILDLILAAKALPPNATAADVRERAKADRRARRGARDRGGRQ